MVSEVNEIDRLPLVKAAFLLLFATFLLAAHAQSTLDNAWVAFSRAGAPSSNLQCFSPANVSVSRGSLVIQTRHEKSECQSIDLPRAAFDYTSGFISMQQFNFLYGTIEFRAKFGGGMDSGAWPAVWMLDASCQASDPTGTDLHCTGEEIDIAEILGSKFSEVNEQIHVEGGNRNDGCTAHVSDVSQLYHTYDLAWSPRSLVFAIDGKITCTLRGRYIPSNPMYVMIDTFIGGLGGPINENSLPWTTSIDYVKVIQRNRVVFYDDFDGAPAQVSAPAISLSDAAARGPYRTLALVTYLKLRHSAKTVLVMLILALMITTAFFVIQRRSA